MNLQSKIILLVQILLLVNSHFQGYSQSKQRESDLPVDTLLTLHTNGLTNEVIPVLQDSTIHGLYQAYYSNGNKKIESEFRHGQPHGITILYDSSGSTLSKEHFEFGVRHGPAVMYSSAEEIESKFWNLDGDVFGLVHRYFSDGKLRSLSFVNNSGEIVYEREFNRQGELILERGVKIFCVYSKDQIAASESFEFVVYSTLPIQERVFFEVMVKEHGIEGWDTTILNVEINDYASSASGEIYFSEPGNYDVEFRCVDADSKDSLDSVIISVDVY